MFSKTVLPNKNDSTLSGSDQLSRKFKCTIVIYQSMILVADKYMKVRTLTKIFFSNNVNTNTVGYHLQNKCEDSC